MELRLTVPVLTFVLWCLAALPGGADADEPVTLIGTIVKWRYPDAEIGESEMSDAATVDAEGNRTAPSTFLKTTLTTPDPVDKVVAFYRDLLKRDPAKDSQTGIEPLTGESVVFRDESAGRPFALHVIVINAENRSTTLVITRGADEDLTRISWQQYLKYETRR